MKPVETKGLPSRKKYEERLYRDFLHLSGNVSRASLEGKYWLLKTAGNNSVTSKKLLQREYETAVTFSNHSIAKVLKFDENTPLGPAMVLEYTDGRTLDEFILERPSKKARKAVLEQLLSAVSFLHSKGMYDNHINSKSIILTTFGDNVRLIDFGIADNEGRKDPHPAAGDIYDLGTVIEKMFFTRNFRHVVSKCHRSNPSGRYDSVASLKRAVSSRNAFPFLFAALAVILLFEAYFLVRAYFFS